MPQILMVMLLLFACWTGVAPVGLVVDVPLGTCGPENSPLHRMVVVGANDPDTRSRLGRGVHLKPVPGDSLPDKMGWNDVYISPRGILHLLVVCERREP